MHLILVPFWHFSIRLKVVMTKFITTVNPVQALTQDMPTERATKVLRFGYLRKFSVDVPTRNSRHQSVDGQKWPFPGRSGEIMRTTDDCSQFRHCAKLNYCWKKFPTLARQILKQYSIGTKHHSSKQHSRPIVTDSITASKRWYVLWCKARTVAPFAKHFLTDIEDAKS